MDIKKIKVVKRIIITIFLLISTSLFGVTIYTEPNPAIMEVAVPSVISININDVVDIRGYKIVVEYDVDVLEFDRADNGELFDGQPIGWWIVNDETPGIIQVESIIFGAGIFVTGPGNILDLTFTAISEGITNLTFIEIELYDPVGMIISDVTAIDGSIIIGDQPPSPQNLIITIVEATLTLSWDEIPYCNYNVYSTYSFGNEEEWFIEAENLTQNSWSCQIPVHENIKLFYITAEFSFSQLE